MLKRTLALAAFTVLCFNTTAPELCAAERPQLVQFYIRTQSDDQRNNLRLTFVKKARAEKIKVETYDAHHKAKEQQELFKHHFAKGIPVIMDLVEPKQASDYANKAARAKTPLIFLFRKPADIELKDNLWFIGTHLEDAGKLQSQMIKDYLSRHKDDFDHNQNGSLDVVLLTGPDKQPEAVVRTEQVEKALLDSGIPHSIKQLIIEDWSYDLSYNKVDNLLINNELSDIEMIVGQNDDMALGAIHALLEQESYTEDSHYFPAVFGIGGTSEALDAIADGLMQGTVKFDNRALSELLLAIIKGEHSYDVLSKISGLTIDSHEIYIPYHPFEIEK